MAADAYNAKNYNFPELLFALAFILSLTSLRREPPWLLLRVLFFPPFSVCSDTQPASLH